MKHKRDICVREFSKPWQPALPGASAARGPREPGSFWGSSKPATDSPPPPILHREALLVLGEPELGVWAAGPFLAALSALGEGGSGEGLSG